MPDQQPRTIAELMEEAHSYEIPASPSIKLYLRAAKEILRHANLYAIAKNYADAYVLYVRFVDLVVNKLPSLPALKKDERSHKKYKLLIQDTPKAMENAEKMKKILEKQIKLYNEYVDEQKRRNEEINKARLQQQQEQQQQQQNNQPSDLKDDFIEVRQNSNDIHDFDDFQFEKHLSDFFSKNDDHKLISPSYPSLAHVYKEEIEDKPLRSILPDHPVLPPKVIAPLPSSIQAPIIQAPITTTIIQPSPQNSSEHKIVQHKSIASSESGKPLKTLFTPQELESSFLKIAQKNTTNKLETCGILCGRLSLNAFFITTLLIPKQESTSNTCQTTDEESIFEYIDNNDLFVLGWIHTHPTQSCFLSSVDLHTQNSYQLMLPEAIAMVCSPKYPSNKFGIFRLTDPPGINIIRNCQRTGFHPHEEGNIYKRCGKGNKGHVVLKTGLPFKVIDLR